MREYVKSTKYTLFTLTYFPTFGQFSAKNSP